MDYIKEGEDAFRIVNGAIECPDCGKILDGMLKISPGNQGPRPGSISVCAYCLCAIILTKEDSYTKLTEEMIAELPPEVSDIIGKVRSNIVKVRSEMGQSH